jgi:hypothetical protein
MESTQKRAAWNKGQLVGQKPPLKPKDIWAIRIYLQQRHAVRDGIPNLNGQRAFGLKLFADAVINHFA